MPGPGVFCLSVRAVLLEAESRGIPGDALLRRNALHRDLLVDPDGWLPLRRHAGLYRDAVAASGDPAAFWVGVGGRAIVQAAELTGHAAATSATVREALETWARFSGLVIDLTRYELRSTAEFDHFAITWPAAYSSLFEDIQVSALIAFRRFVAYIAGPVAPTRAFLARPPPASPSVVEEALGAPVRWNEEWPALAFAPGTFDRPIHFPDPALRALLVRAAERKLEMRTARRASDRVRAAILELGFDRSAKVAVVAEALGTTARTLQRWLARESLTFSGVRGETLGRAAAEAFREDGASVAEVAFRLGFSSRNAFHRAIRRWTGKTPVELRDTARRGESPAGSGPDGSARKRASGAGSDAGRVNGA